MRERMRALATSPRMQVALLAGAIGLALLAGILVWRAQRTPTVVLDVQRLDDPAIVRVWVGGAVEQPGLYTLPRGSRVADALEAAGGARTDADTTALGMAAVINDADQIIVPQRAAAPQGNGGSPGATPGQTPAQIVNPGLININVAATTELESLPGIGPALATRIVEYRTSHGPFQTVDELVDIAGISQRMVDELRPLVTVGP